MRSVLSTPFAMQLTSAESLEREAGWLRSTSALKVFGPKWSLTLDLIESVV